MRTFSIVIGVWSLLGILILNVAPIGSEQLEYWMRWFFLLPLPMAGLLFTVFVLRNPRVPPMGNKEWFSKNGNELVRVVIPLLLVPILQMRIHNRTDYGYKLRLAVDGTISEKYLSRNHRIPSLKVELNTGKVITIEGIPYPVWKQISVGAPIQKAAWEETASINGESLRIVE